MAIACGILAIVFLAYFLYSKDMDKSTFGAGICITLSVGAGIAALCHSSTIHQYTAGDYFRDAGYENKVSTYALLTISLIFLVVGLSFLAVNLQNRFGWNIKRGTAMVLAVSGMTALSLGGMYILQEAVGDVHYDTINTEGLTQVWSIGMALGIMFTFYCIYYAIMGKRMNWTPTFGKGCLVLSAGAFAYAFATCGNYAKGIHEDVLKDFAKETGRKTLDNEEEAAVLSDWTQSIGDDTPVDDLAEYFKDFSGSWGIYLGITLLAVGISYLVYQKCKKPVV